MFFNTQKNFLLDTGIDKTCAYPLVQRSSLERALKSLEVRKKRKITFELLSQTQDITGSTQTLNKSPFKTTKGLSRRRHLFPLSLLSQYIVLLQVHTHKFIAHVHTFVIEAIKFADKIINLQLRNQTSLSLSIPSVAAFHHTHSQVQFMFIVRSTHALFYYCIYL